VPFPTKVEPETRIFGILWYYFCMTLSHAAALEAVLFAGGEPLSKKRLAALLNLSPEQLRDAAIELHTTLEKRGGLALIEAGEEIELRTSPDAADVVQKLREGELSRDLGKAGLEVLAVILYKNGATRSEIDWVRGVNSAAAVRSLTLRGLVERSEDANDRRRIRYTATIDALAHLGVSNARELPRYAEFANALTEAEVAVANEDGESDKGVVVTAELEMSDDSDET
jgi:segregation and condensation protein B